MESGSSKYDGERSLSNVRLGTKEVTQRLIKQFTVDQLVEHADCALEHALWLLAIMSGYTMEEVLEIEKDRCDGYRRVGLDYLGWPRTVPNQLRLCIQCSRGRTWAREFVAYETPLDERSFVTGGGGR